MTFVRNILESSSSVQHTSISQSNEEDLERVQKSAFRIILGRNDIDYPHALTLLNMDTLKERREKLFCKFAQKCRYEKTMKKYLMKKE